MSKFYKHQWFGRTSEYPNVTEPKDEFYEDIRRVNTKERLAIEKYMMTEYDYQREIPNKPGYDTRMDMNLHPYYAKTICPHHHLEDEHAYHVTNDDTNCDYWNPQESDIVNMKGYNATNIRIMHQVSKRIADLTKLLGLINDLTKPLDLAYIQCKCPAINSSLFRTILSVAFNELLKKDMALATKLQALIIPAETPAEKDPEPGSSATGKTDTVPAGTSIHRPEYTNYPKISEEFIERILKQIFEEGNWKPTEGKPGHQDNTAPVQPPVLPEVKPPTVEGTPAPTPTKPEGTTETTPIATVQPSPTSEHTTAPVSPTEAPAASATTSETTHAEPAVTPVATTEHPVEATATTTVTPAVEPTTVTGNTEVTQPVVTPEESHN